MPSLDLPARPITRDDAATFLGVSPTTIKRLIAAGKLGAIRVGRQVRIRPEALESFMQSSARKNFLHEVPRADHPATAQSVAQRRSGA